MGAHDPKLALYIYPKKALLRAYSTLTESTHCQQ